MNLQQQIDDMKYLMNKNNFSNTVVYDKGVLFNSRVFLKSITTNPTFGDVGDLVVVGGKLKICTTASSTAATYTIVGTQT